MGAAQTMADSLLPWFREADLWALTSQGLNALLHEANQAIFDWGLEPGTGRPLGGCAGSVAWIYQGKLTVFHAGDTVAMLLRPGHRPRLLTRAHEIDGALDRYFGIGRHLRIDVEATNVEDGDMVLLMSDGVTKVFSTTEAADLIREVYDRCGAIGRAAEELVVRSRGKGSADDITVMVIEVIDE
jgi:serine/threonine protein phosphatase PrpC